MRGKRRHHRYAVIDEDDDKLESMEMLPKGSLCAYVNFSGNTVFCLMGFTVMYESASGQIKGILPPEPANARISHVSLSFWPGI